MQEVVEVVAGVEVEAADPVSAAIWASSACTWASSDWMRVAVELTALVDAVVVGVVGVASDLGMRALCGMKVAPSEIVGSETPKGMAMLCGKLAGAVESMTVDVAGAGLGD